MDFSTELGKVLSIQCLNYTRRCKCKDQIIFLTPNSKFTSTKSLRYPTAKIQDSNCPGQWASLVVWYDICYSIAKVVGLNSIRVIWDGSDILKTIH